MEGFSKHIVDDLNVSSYVILHRVIAKFSRTFDTEKNWFWNTKEKLRA